MKVIGRRRRDAVIAELRQAVAPGTVVPDDLAAYVEKVRRHAYKVTDAEVEALRRDYSDDELFEVTVATAVDAGFSRLDVVLDAMGGPL